MNTKNMNEPNNDSAPVPTDPNPVATEPLASNTPKTALEYFIEMRSRGVSLRNISYDLRIPKSTLFDWERRNASRIQALSRMEVEGIEDMILGSRVDQMRHLASTLKDLDIAFNRKLAKRQEYLSATEIFWMAAHLRQEVNRLCQRGIVTALPDASSTAQDASAADAIRTNPDKTPPPTQPCASS